MVSIITPTFNSQLYIASTINSIIAQSYKNWELLITDDCSTDETWKIITDFSKKDSRIKIFRLENNFGPGIARNNSIKHAIGRYIAFCDSDDQWIPTKLEKQIAFMEEYQITFSYSNYYVIDENGSPLKQVTTPDRVTYKTMLRNNYIGCLTAVYDTKLVGKMYMPIIRKRQDWALWLAILKKIPYALNLQENLAIYRDRSKSISSNKIDLIKYNWIMYKNVEKFSFIKSIFLLIQFQYYYFKKRLY